MKNAHVYVTGMGVSGPPVVGALLASGARVTVIDDRDDSVLQQRAHELRALGAETRLGSTNLDADVTLVVTSPGWRPSHPILMEAARRNIEVIGDVEFAWRLDQERSLREGSPAPTWLTLTGTNGKTTTVGMLASILKAADLRSVATGNVGYSIVSAVLAEPRFEVLAVELSSFQLHWVTSLSPKAGALINIAEDHIDWHGSYDAYRADKEKLLRSAEIAIVNLDDEGSARSVADHSRRIGITRDIPRVQEVGVVEDFLVDRAFSDPAVEIATFADIKPLVPHNITNALIASALARSIGVSSDAISRGLRDYQSGGHRIELIATLDGVRYVNDSKATNPHAAAAALSAFTDVIWIAGGLAKGASMDELIRTNSQRLKAVLLIGLDREVIADSLARHAPDVRVERIDPIDTEPVGVSVMRQCVSRARALAKPGDTVLLAPACASMDQFTSYDERGQRFAEAVTLL